MLKNLLLRRVATAAMLIAIGGKTILSAQENDDPMDLDDGATSTCSYGTSNVCYEKTTTITICNAFRPISIDGSINPGRGGGVGVKLECSESEIRETKETRYWSK